MMLRIDKERFFKYEYHSWDALGGSPPPPRGQPPPVFRDRKNHVVASTGEQTILMGVGPGGGSARSRTISIHLTSA